MDKFIYYPFKSLKATSAPKATLTTPQLSPPPARLVPRSEGGPAVALWPLIGMGNSDHRLKRACVSALS